VVHKDTAKACFWADGQAKQADHTEDTFDAKCVGLCGETGGSNTVHEVAIKGPRLQVEAFSLLNPKHVLVTMTCGTPRPAFEVKHMAFHYVYLHGLCRA